MERILRALDGLLFNGASYFLLRSCVKFENLTFVSAAINMCHENRKDEMKTFTLGLIPQQQDSQHCEGASVYGHTHRTQPAITFIPNKMERGKA